MERVTDERISYVLDSVENRWAFVGPDEMESLLRELQSRRAADTMRPEWHHADEPAERGQAAPKEPTGAWAVKSQLEDKFDGERWRFTVEKWEAHHDDVGGDAASG